MNFNNTAETGKTIFYIILIAVFIIMAVHYLRAKNPAKTGLKGMISGVLSLFAVHFWGGYAGIYLPLNLFTSVISIVLGMPAVIIMSLIEKFF